MTPKAGWYGLSPHNKSDWRCFLCHLKIKSEKRWSYCWSLEPPGYATHASTQWTLWIVLLSTEEKYWLVILSIKILLTFLLNCLFFCLAFWLFYILREKATVVHVVHVFSFLFSAKHEHFNRNLTGSHHMSLSASQDKKKGFSNLDILSLSKTWMRQIVLTVVVGCFYTSDWRRLLSPSPCSFLDRNVFFIFHPVCTRS